MSVFKDYPGEMYAVFPESQEGMFSVKKVKIPEPGPSEVLIKIAAAPINPSDLAKVREAQKEKDFSSFIPGLEGSGVVVKAGKGLMPRLWLGKRVACSSKYNFSGSWAEYMVTPATMCFPLRRKVSDEQGSMSLVNPLTALEFFEIVKKEGHKALINNAAASALGRMIELLGNKNRIPVINLVRSGNQAEVLRQSGSKYVLYFSDPQFYEKLSALAEDLEATLYLDSICSSELPSVIGALPVASSVIIYGNMTQTEFININPKDLILRNIKISGFFLGNKAKENSLVKNIINLMRVGRLMSDDMKIRIQATFPLIKIQEAVDTYLNNMSGGKVILKP
jgi:NADPH:quinone reductase